MERITSFLFLTPIFILGMAVQAAEDSGRNGRRNDDRPSHSLTPGRNNSPAHRADHDRAKAQREPQPSDPRNRDARPVRMTAPEQDQRSHTAIRPKRDPAPQAAKDRTRPSYTRPYDRRRLSRLGVKDAPKPISDRSSVLRTQRSRSTFDHPKAGPKGERIRGSSVPARKFNNRAVRAQMSVVVQPNFDLRLAQERRHEYQRNRNYWHTDNGFNYNHRIDDRGYHWYGWYRGDQYFWTRNHNGRWWWYDADYDRWCYYQDANWYWQDPYYPDDLYVYDNDSYLSLSFNYQN